MILLENERKMKETQKEEILLNLAKKIQDKNNRTALTPLCLTVDEEKRLQTDSFLTNAKKFSVLFQYLNGSMSSYAFTKKMRDMKMGIDEHELLTLLQERKEKVRRKNDLFPSLPPMKDEDSITSLLYTLTIDEKKKEKWEQNGFLPDLRLYASLKDYIENIEDTNQFYCFRDLMKSSSGEDKLRRNQMIELLITGNKELELVYDFTKFQRIIEKSYNKWNTVTRKKLGEQPVTTTSKKPQEKQAWTEEIISFFSINATHSIYKSLQERNSLNKKNFFEKEKYIEQSDTRPFESIYHFISTLTTEDFPIDVLCYYLVSLDVNGKDLIQAARDIEIGIHNHLQIINKGLSHALHIIEIFNTMSMYCNQSTITKQIDGYMKSCVQGGQLNEEYDPAIGQDIKKLVKY